MSLIDLFKEFHSRAIVDVYPPSARALFDTFIFDFNAAFWPEERVYSERELSRLTGLTPATTHRSLKFLSDHGHIKTKSSKRGTVVKLTGVTWSTNEAPMKHLRSTCEAPVKHPDEVPIIRACEDVKTLDVKTFTSFDDDNAGARACDNRNFEDGVTATPVDTPAEPIDTLTEYWERDLHGGRLTIEHLSEIQMLVDRHGVDWVKEAMQIAADSNGSSYGVSIKLFRAVVRRKLNPLPKPNPTLKGGERGDRGNESARRNVVALPDTYDPARDPVDWRQYLTGTGTSAERP